MEQFDRLKADSRAAQLRGRFRVLECPTDGAQLAPISPDLSMASSSFPRNSNFDPKGAHLDLAPTGQRCVHLGLKVMAEATISLRCEPFVQLFSLGNSGEKTLLGRWPCFPGIGGQNGPGTITTDNFVAQVRWKIDTLSMDFKIEPRPVTETGFRKLISKFKYFWNKNFGRAASLETQHFAQCDEFLKITCQPDSLSGLPFTVRGSANWKVAA